MERTGARIRQLVTEAGYSVKAIQQLLCLSCPQPVYRWFKGQVLPTVDHLFALSRLLGVHMEDFLVCDGEYMTQTDLRRARLSAYSRHMARLVA
ncbi:MAG: helix-turn-helix transcriptional regulator [Lachnospiraceae bacterium]|nr:helix-turn-helix transcriptional regulator [Lachnospiraceae bacterium]